MSVSEHHVHLRPAAQLLQRYREDRTNLKTAQDQEGKSLKRRHEMQALDLQRKQRALEKVERRELKSLEEALRCEIRVQDRGGRNQMPSMALTLKSAKARQHAKGRGAREQFNSAVSGREEGHQIDLTKDFAKAPAMMKQNEKTRFRRDV